MLWTRKTLIVTCRMDEAEWKDFRALVDNAAPYSNGYSAHVRRAIFEYMERLRAAAGPPAPPPARPPAPPAERNTKRLPPKKKPTPVRKSSKSERNRK